MQFVSGPASKTMERLEAVLDVVIFALVIHFKKPKRGGHIDIFIVLSSRRISCSPPKSLGVIRLSFCASSAACVKVSTSTFLDSSYSSEKYENKNCHRLL